MVTADAAKALSGSLSYSVSAETTTMVVDANEHLFAEKAHYGPFSIKNIFLS